MIEGREMGDVKEISQNQQEVDILLATYSNKRWYEEKVVKAFTFTFYQPHERLFLGPNTLIITLGMGNSASRPGVSK